MLKKFCKGRNGNGYCGSVKPMFFQFWLFYQNHLGSFFTPHLLPPPKKQILSDSLSLVLGWAQKLTFFLNKLYFLELFQIHRKIEQKVPRFPIGPQPAQTQPPLLSASHTRMVHLLQWMSPRRCIIITQSAVYIRGHSWVLTHE